MRKIDTARLAELLGDVLGMVALAVLLIVSLYMPEVLGPEVLGW